MPQPNGVSSPPERTDANAIDFKFDQGLALHHQGKLSDAERAYAEVLQHQPNHFDALHLLGVIALQTRRTEKAIELIGKAISLNTKIAAAYSNLGTAFKDLKRPNEALASYDRAIALEPGYAEAHGNRGLVLLELKRPEEALASFERAITLKPDYAKAHLSRGVALKDLDRPEEALASFDRAIALQPDYAEAHNNRGNVLRDHLNRPEDAIASFDRAIALQPGQAEAYSNRGNALKDLSRLEDALASYDKALALNADYAEGHSNRGNALQDLKRPEEALSSYDRAIALQADFARAYWNRSLCLLLMGRLEQGWRQYEWRKKQAVPIAARSFHQPLWLGDESIAGKTLFIWWEQGLGDTIQFCRYARVAEARGATVIMSVQQSLAGLLKQISPTIRIAGQDEVPAEFDYHCPLLSLPLSFRTTLETIPAEPRYLRADGALRLAWAARLSPKTKPRIGVVWSGSTAHKNDHNRSMQLEQLVPILGPDAHWICLQKEIRGTDAAVLRQNGHVAYFGDDLGDFNDTAALLDLMDLVITIDTSVAHLAGAMGKPVWILLPHNPDWRWQLDREDSPWYPSARLFRQRRIGDWAEVIDRVKSELRTVTG
jgi:hypothetical protein